MRTTIELSNEQRSELLSLAARRGLKGFSQLIQEAVDSYLRQQSGRDEAIRSAVALRGSLDRRAADRFEERVKELRRSWR